MHFRHILALLLIAAVPAGAAEKFNLNLRAAITKQISDVDNATDKIRSLIEIVTVVHGAGELHATRVSTPPGFTVVSLKETNRQVNTNATKDLKQRWQFELDPGKNNRLNGNYSIHFRVVSKPGFDCGLSETKTDFSLQSETWSVTTLDVKLKMPDLVGKTAQDAVKIMQPLKVKTVFAGGGHVIRTTPAAGATLDEKTTVRVELK